MDNQVVVYQGRNPFFDLLADRLNVVPRDTLFFDDVFSQMERQVARLHQDMRNAMLHLKPVRPMSPSTQDLENRLQRLRDVYSTAEDGSRHLDVTLDMSSFRPEEIVVKVEGDRLLVRARHEERDEHSFMHSEFQREFKLPPGTDVNQIQTSLSKDGVLSIKGPTPAVGTRVIPIALEY